jgi:hypothetical protein
MGNSNGLASIASRIGFESVQMHSNEPSRLSRKTELEIPIY